MACFIFRLLHSIRIVRNKSTEKKEWLHHSINIQLNVQVFSKEIIFIDAIVVIAYSIVFLPIFNSHVPFFSFQKPINIFFPTLFYSMKWKKGKKSKYFPKKVERKMCEILRIYEKNWFLKKIKSKKYQALPYCSWISICNKIMKK